MVVYWVSNISKKKKIIEVVYIDYWKHFPLTCVSNLPNWTMDMERDKKRETYIRLQFEIILPQEKLQKFHIKNIYFTYITHGKAI